MCWMVTAQEPALSDTFRMSSVFLERATFWSAALSLIGILVQKFLLCSKSSLEDPCHLGATASGERAEACAPC